MSSVLRPRKAAMAFILVTAALDIVAMGIIIPVLPALIEEFAGADAQAGTINGALIALWAMMQFFSSPVIGSLSDRFGRRPVILLSALGLAADYVLMAVAPTMWWLVAGRAIAGITSSSFTTVFAYMADVTAPDRRARAYGLVGAAFSAGFIAGPLLGGLLGELSPRAPFWAAATLSGMTFLYGLFVLPESLAPENRMGFSWRRANPFGSLRLLRSHPELSGLALVNFLLHFAHHVFPAVFVLYAAHRHGWSARDVGLLLAAVGTLDMTVQGVLVSRIAGRLGDRATLFLGLFGGACGLAWMGLAPNGTWFALSIVPTALCGLAMPTIQSLMTQRVSAFEQGQLQGANMSVASLAGILSPVFFGTLYSASIGAGALFPFPGTPFLVAGLVLLAGALIGWTVARRNGRAAEADGMAA
ncbi:TCR/Tet family MFS transporter [Azospirillum picis]|uniref:DHA1 family tetracycline resistance protein-like MFS transporter n=1 Tax=Azospirillum picis TaxID=488438 RepID=A0ABU0MNZ7_9PROT|nr:TCR/Tet family MFS transporter [Azospirillum picis]MBP2301365.1 DHA1 family tetracycline resistance protein-like MFS transporter [Azospirillum picis]MDQ0535196.1 DHA1 family tetracycline resistance protein-like MFS transporter [Azospirillum picis]